MSNDHIAARRARQLQELRREFVGWRIDRPDTGRWLAIRENVCIRAASHTELRTRIREFVEDTGRGTGPEGGESV